MMHYDAVGEVARQRKEDTTRRQRDTRTKRAFRRKETGTFAYMVTDYGGTKGPRALGPLFLEDASLLLSSSPSSFSSTPSRTLQRTPNYLCLHIYLLSPFRSFFPSLFFFGHPSPVCIMHLKIA